MRLPRLRSALLTFAAAGLAASVAFAAPLKVAYSDWPGWTAFAIAEQKGWFKDAGVDVDLLWFEYGPSMEAFTAGKVDAVMVTNGDGLVTGAGGAKNISILITDYSNGNDMIVAKPGIESMKDLKGKKVGIEVGFVEHLLLLKALESAGLSESDVEIVPTPTGQTPQVLASGQVDAIGAWQPNSGGALKAVPGSKAIFTSANVPGLIYDTVSVSPQSLAEHRAEWLKFVAVWDKIVAYLADPATRADGIKIMAAKAGVDAATYAEFLPGTKFLPLADGAKILASAAAGFGSVAGSSKIADDFNVKNGVYKVSQPVADYIDASLMAEAAAPKKAPAPKAEAKK
ncbi:ABC transporter substrate-binding protein [Verrucomicrobia bacterium IMCC26134]|nr:ABC transporter substrate-binding protein [Verrucomicrobia bacterium IMCC26134]